MTATDGDEEYYPRGGSSDNGKKKIKTDRTYVFQSKKAVKVPKKKPGRRERLRDSRKKIILEHQAESEDEVKEILDNPRRLQLFKYENLRDGTLSMCCVLEVFPTFILVALPEKLTAYLPLDLISQPFKSLIKQGGSNIGLLKKYFPIGYCLPCRVMNAKKHENNFNVTISTDPCLVYSNLSFNLITVGFTMVAAVQSREDHGFIMMTGVKGVRAFLPFCKVSKGFFKKPVDIGHLLWCKVTKSKLSETCNTVELSADLDEISSAKLAAVQSSDILTPGAQVNVSIAKVLPKLLFVNALNSDEKGYIPCTQLDDVWSKVTDYKIGSEHSVTVLYKFPHLDIVCFSLCVKPNSVLPSEIEKGTICENAKIIDKNERSVSLQLALQNKIYKGQLSMNRLKKEIDNIEKIDELFPLGNHIRVRVLNYHSIDRMYSCNNSDEKLENGGSVSDYSIGKIVEIKITGTNNKGFIGHAKLCRVFVPFIHATDDESVDPKKLIKMNQEYKGRILAKQETFNSLLVTLRPTLVQNKPLVNFNNAKIGEEYFGLVCKIMRGAIVVMFFNKLTAYIPETRLTTSAKKYKVGQLVKCYVVKKDVDGKPPVLSVSKPLDKMELKIGNSYPTIVKSITEEGLCCVVLENKKPLECFIPVGHLCDSLKLCSLMLNKFEVGKTIDSAILYSYDDNQTPIFTLRHSVQKFFKENPLIKENGFEGLKQYVKLPATISSIQNNMMTLYVPVAGYNGKVFARIPPKLKRFLHINQGITVKVIKLYQNAKILKVACNMQSVVSFIKKEMTLYLQEISKYQSRTPGELLKVKVVSIDKNENKAEVELPDNTKGIITLLNNENLKINKNIQAIFLYEDVLKNESYLTAKSQLEENQEDDSDEEDENSHMKIVYIGEDFCIGIVLHSTEVIILNTVNPKLLQKFEKIKGYPLLSSNINKPDDIQICGKFKIGHVFWYHLIKMEIDKKIIGNEKENDDNLENEDDVENNEDSDEDETEIIKMMQKSEKKNIEKQKLKRKLVENYDSIEENDFDESNEDSEDEDETAISKKKQTSQKNNIGKQKLKRKSIDDDEHLLEPSLKKRKEKNKERASLDNDEPFQDGNKKKSKIFIDNLLEKSKSKTKELNDSISKAAKQLKQKKLKELENITLESVGGFNWDATPTDLAKTVAQGKMDYASEDSDEEVVVKKKLTPAEKKAAQIEAERILREKEEELLKSEENPQSADHFERLLLATPNNSKLWIQYMAFHLQGTDIEKARIVAKRGISQINVREEQEKLNLWIALLNLENNYGTTESFEKTLTEALKFNDDYQVYMKVLGMYSEAQRVADLDKLTNHLVRKYKGKPECWLECLTALMAVGLAEKARNLLQRSLSSLPQKSHIYLISRFALIENKHGFQEQAHSLFENLITSYPQRIDLWNVYVNMLVKSGSINLARNVLERIPSHKLPIRKMKALYKKWLQFEEKYGTENNVENVRKAAENHVIDLLGPMDKTSNKKEAANNKGENKKKNVENDDNEDEEEMEVSAEEEEEPNKVEEDDSNESDGLSDDDDEESG